MSVIVTPITKQKGENIMINKVSFTGRETMLTASLKRVENLPEVIKASSILPKQSVRNLVTVKPEKVNYTSPYAPILDNFKPVSENSKISGLNIFG